MKHTQEKILLFPSLDTVFLRSDEIKKGLRSPIELVKLPILAMLVSGSVEDRKKKCAVMQGAVLNHASDD